MRKYSAPEGCTFPQLGRVLDSKQFASILAQAMRLDAAGVRVVRIRPRGLTYKPGEVCRVLLEARLHPSGQAKTSRLYVAEISSLAQAEREFRLTARRRLQRPPYGLAAALLPELATVLWAFPNDPHLPGLATLDSIAAVRGFLLDNQQRFGFYAGAEIVAIHSELAKYAPARRAGYRYGVQWRHANGKTAEQLLFGKAYPETRGAAVHEVMRQLEASPACRSGRLRVPRTYAYDSEHGILWQEFLVGPQVPRDPGSWVRKAAQGGQALAAFQNSSIRLGPGKNLLKALMDLQEAVAEIGKSYPEHREACLRLGRRLSAAAPGLPTVPLRPVHGSFRSNRLIEVRGRTAMVDFDRAGMGDPVYDLGSFQAHLLAASVEGKAEPELVESACRALRAEYEPLVHWGWPEERVLWYTCARLITSHVYKRARRGHSERIPALLRCAEQMFPEEAGRQVEA
jgi:phosphotransferase family enzyme